MIISYHHESNGFAFHLFKTGDVQWQLSIYSSNEFRGVLLFSLRQAHENPK
jgi:hypothetical protein